MKCRNIQPFVLILGDPINDQPKDNVPNVKLKSLYNMEKSSWILKYAMKKFLPHYMKSVLIESWDTFKVSAGNIVKGNFAKTNLLPLISTDLTTNNQSCAASVQVSYGSKAEEINNMLRQTVAPIELQFTGTDDTMVFLQAKGAQQSARKDILWDPVYDAVRK